MALVPTPPPPSPDGPLFAEVEMGADSYSPTVRATVVQASTVFYELPPLLVFEGEEMDFLEQQGIHVKIIPGITAASGIAAELGIPLTHRGVANSVRFLTGHSRKGVSLLLFYLSFCSLCGKKKPIMSVTDI